MRQPEANLEIQSEKGVEPVKTSGCTESLSPGKGQLAGGRRELHKYLVPPTKEFSVWPPEPTTNPGLPGRASYGEPAPSGSFVSTDCHPVTLMLPHKGNSADFTYGDV